MERKLSISSQNFDYPTCLQVGDINITEPTQISNSFNDYFTSIADDILAKHKYNGTQSFRDFLSNRLLENFVFAECTENEIETTISSLNLHKSSGPHSIPTDVLHLLKNTFLNPLTKSLIFRFLLENTLIY